MRKRFFFYLAIKISFQHPHLFPKNENIVFYDIYPNDSDLLVNIACEWNALSWLINPPRSNTFQLNK